MNKTLKWILVGLAGMIAVGIAVAYLILVSYDFNSLKPRVASAVKEATGRELDIGGDIEFSFGLTPSLVVSDVAFENASWGSRPNLADIRRLEVEVALLPLLAKNIRVKRFILVEPDILLESDQSGKLNVVFDKAASPVGEKRPEKPSEEAPMKLPSLSMEELVVENGTFTYKDLASNQTHKARITRMEASSEGMDSPVELVLDAIYNESPIRMEGQLGAPTAATNPEEDWMFDLKISALGIETAVNGKIRDLMAPSGIQLALNANIENFKALNPVVEPLLNMKVPPLAPVRLSANVSDTEKMVLAVSDLDLKFGADDIHGQVKGSVRDLLQQEGVKLYFSMEVKDLRKLSEFFGAEMPPVAPLSLKTSVADVGKMAFKLEDLDLAFAGNDISGDATVNLSGKKPTIKANLASSKMDLNSVINGMEQKGDEAEKPAEPAKGKAGEGAEKSGKVFPDEPLPFNMLKSANADIGYKARDLFLPNLALHQVDIGVRLQNGNLAVSPLTAELGGGRLNGSVMLNVRSENMAGAKVDISTTNFDLGSMLKEMQITDLMSGRVNVDLDVTTAGGSVASFMGGLDGHSKIVMENGAIHNKYVGLIGAKLDKAIAQILMPGRDKKDFTAVNCFVNRFDFKKGLATATVLFMDSEFMSMTGEGTIDLGTETLNMALIPKPKDKIAEVGVSIGQLASNFRIAGTLENPKVKVDTAGAVKTVEKALRGISAKGGVLGALSALEGETTGSEDLCTAAKEAAASGQKMRLQKKTEQQKSTAPSIEDEAASPAEQKPLTKEEKRRREIENIGNVLKGILKK